MENNNRIIVVPYGGHGTTYITKHIKTLNKPDTVFKWDFNIEKDKPLPSQKEEWLRRAKTELNLDLTMEENLLEVINKRDKTILLSGICSDHYPFLTLNEIECICIVRNPLLAYESFMGRRHRNHAARFGGYETEGAILWWCLRWNNITTDFIYAPKASIVRYEHLLNDIDDVVLKNKLRGWIPSEKRSQLNKNLSDMLKELTEENYNLILEKVYKGLDQRIKKTEREMEDNLNEQLFGTSTIKTKNLINTTTA